MKSYTTIEQSRKLAETLPLDSADMSYIGEYNALTVDYLSAKKEFDTTKEVDIFPCWSLAVLLDVLPDCPDLSKHTDNKWDITTYPNGVHTCLMAFDNPVDACVAMIENLNELKML